MGHFPVWGNLKPKSIDIVHKKVYECKDKGRVKKRGTDPFLSHSILPFLDCPYFRTFFLWTTSMLLGCGRTKLGKGLSKMATSNHSIAFGCELLLLNTINSLYFTVINIVLNGNVSLIWQRS
jgi:hypothetical protein